MGLVGAQVTYGAMFEHALDGVLLTAPDGTILAANPAARQMLGRTEDEICRLGRSGLVDPASPMLGAALSERARLGRTRAELTFCRADGSRFVGEITSALFTDDAGQPRTAVIFRDVTLRKQSEDALRESESRFRTLASSAPVGIFQTDALGRFVYANDRWCEYAGMSAAQALGHGWTAALHPDDRERVEARWYEAAAAGDAPFEEEVRFQRPDGTVRWLVGSASAVRGDHDEILGYVGTVTDITERRKTEDALRESEARLRGLIAHSPLPYALNDEALRVTYLNPAFVRAFGYELADIPTVAEWWPKAYPDAGYREHVEREWMSRLERSTRGDTDFEPLEVQIRCKDGSSRTTIVWAHSIGAGFGGTHAVVFHDITERKQLEESRLNSQRLESLGTLAGGIAHDFNNLLMAILGNAEVAALAAGANAGVSEPLDEVRRGCVRAAELIRRITAFARPKERGTETVEMGPVVEEVLQLLRATIPAGISIKSRFAADVPPVDAAAAQVHEVLVNLTTNAVDAIGTRTGSIAYELSGCELAGAAAARLALAAGRYVRLVVKDDGAGMDDATRARIFDAFFTTKPLGKGTGLGLSMVYGVMKAHRGAVAVESAPGAGTTFTLYFPVAKVVARAPDRAESPATSAAPTKGLRVLHVDDEAALVRTFARSFEHLGHRATGFTDPVEALAHFGEDPQRYDVVVTDLSMPNMSGLDFARAILAVRDDVPVVLATGYSDLADEARAREAGIRAVLSKPFSMAQLEETLGRFARAAGT